MADVSCSLVVVYLQCNGKLKKISRCCTSWLLYTLFTSWYYPWAHTCRVMYPGSYTGKGKAIPVQAWTGSESSWRLRFPHFKTVCLRRWLGYQPFAWAAFTPKEIFLVLAAVRSWVDHRTLVWTEELCQWKTPMTPPRIEPATLRLVARCFNQLRYREELHKV